MSLLKHWWVLFWHDITEWLKGKHKPPKPHHKKLKHVTLQLRRVC